LARGAILWLEEMHMSLEQERALERKRAEARERVRLAQEREARKKEELRRLTMERASARKHVAGVDPKADVEDDELVG